MWNWIKKLFGIKQKPKYKLGKLPAKLDARTLKLSTVLKALPPVPESFDVDSQFPGFIDNNMYLNDRLGDCVIAARAHMTLRFECFEQKCTIPISDNDVKTEYFKETGGPDNGLNMLDSLNQWRQNGWTAAGHLYKIHAFASVDWKNHEEVKAAAYLFNGLYFGMRVPQSALDQNGAGQPWTVVANDGGIQGGHALYKVGYIKIISLNTIGPVCMTWGARQQMTWGFWDTYLDECYIVIDERDDWLNPATDPLDIPLLEQYLAQIGSVPSMQITISTSFLPTGTVGKHYSTTLAASGGVLPYHWTLYAGKLPSGLILSDSGTIAGKPGTAGKYPVTFLCTDSAGNASGVILNLQVKRSCLLGL